MARRRPAAARTTHASCATPTRRSWTGCCAQAAGPSGWSRSRPNVRAALDAVRRIVDAGAVAALGHTDASYALTREAIEAGARVGTHLFNAMAPVHHREPGPAVALLEDDRG